VVNLVAVCGVSFHPVEAELMRIYIPIEFDCLATDEAVFDCRLRPQAWKASKDCVQGAPLSPITCWADERPTRGLSSSHKKKTPETEVPGVIFVVVLFTSNRNGEASNRAKPL